MLIYKKNLKSNRIYDNLKITTLLSYNNNSKHKRELAGKRNTSTCCF